MQDKLTTLIEDYEQLYSRIPADASKIKPAHVRTLADLASVITAQLAIKQLPGTQTLNNKVALSLEDSIVDELSGAESKYLEYIKHQDPTLLNMAKDELRHASYYLSQAKMSHDHGLLQRLKDYQAWYTQIESKFHKAHEV